MKIAWILTLLLTGCANQQIAETRLTPEQQATINAKVAAQQEAQAIAHHRAEMDAADQILESCGPPYSDISSENADPRPPIPTRILTYRKQRIKVIFIPAANLGDDPPYRWNLLTVTDSVSNQPIKSVTAIKKRLPCISSK